MVLEASAKRITSRAKEEAIRVEESQLSKKALFWSIWRSSDGFQLPHVATDQTSRLFCVLFLHHCSRNGPALMRQDQKRKPVGDLHHEGAAGCLVSQLSHEAANVLLLRAVSVSQLGAVACWS